MILVQVYNQVCETNFQTKHYIECNLDLVTLNLVKTCNLVTIFQGPFFNFINKFPISEIPWATKTTLYENT